MIPTSPSQSKDIDKMIKLQAETKKIAMTLKSDLSMNGNENSENASSLHYETGSNLNIKYYEKELEKCREQNSILVRKYHQSLEEIEASHQQISRQSTTIKLLRTQIEELNKQIDELKEFKETNFQKSSERIFKREENLISSYNKPSSEMQRVENYKTRSAILEKRIEDQLKEIEQLKNLLNDSEFKMRQILNNKKAEENKELEIAKLKEDKEKLLQMLRTTKEFGNICDNLERDEIIYKAKCSPQNFLRKCDVCNQENHIEWIPEEARKIIDDFKLNNSTELSNEIFDKLLIDLNKIWKEREKKMVGKIKKELNSEIATLKRQLSSRVPFEEVVANRQITRLKTEIHNANKEVKQIQIAKEKEKIGPYELEIVEETIKIASALQKQRKQFQEENSSLLIKIQEYDRIYQSKDYEKSKFMEGASWIGRRLYIELDRLLSRYENIISEFFKRIGENEEVLEETQKIQMNSNQSWFKKAIEIINNEVQEKFRNHIESAALIFDNSRKNLPEHLSNLENESSYYIKDLENMIQSRESTSNYI